MGCLAGEDGDETVHLAVDLDGLDDLAAVSLETAIEIVEPDTRRNARGPIEELAGPPLADGVETLLFPPGDKVVALVENHAPHGGNLVGRILQIGVHGEDDLALRGLEPAKERGRLAVIAGETDGPDGGKLLPELSDDVPRTVGRTVVDEDNFVGKAVVAGHAVDPRGEFGQRLLLVVERNDDRNIGITHGRKCARDRTWRDCAW